MVVETDSPEAAARPAIANRPVGPRPYRIVRAELVLADQGENRLAGPIEYC